MFVSVNSILSTSPGSKAMDYSNGLFDCQSPTSPFLGGLRVLHLLEDLRAALELMDNDERDNLRCQIPDSTAEGLAEWLQGRLVKKKKTIWYLEYNLQVFLSSNIIYSPLVHIIAINLNALFAIHWSVFQNDDHHYQLHFITCLEASFVVSIVKLLEELLHKLDACFWNLCPFLSHCEVDLRLFVNSLVNLTVPFDVDVVGHPSHRSYLELKFWVWNRFSELVLVCQCELPASWSFLLLIKSQ